MSKRKLLLGALLFGVVVLVVTVLRRGDGGGVDEIDTGTDDTDTDEGDGGGIDRVTTRDEDESGDAGAASVADIDRGGGRFDDLDLFDYVAILGAAFKAAREEYESRID